MRFFSVKPAPALSLQGKVFLLGDKSIASRAIIISAISCGKTLIENFPASKDCLATINVFRKLGVKIIQSSASESKQRKTISVLGKGLYGLKRPKGNIFVGDSGTTLRLVLGILAGQKFNVTLTTGTSLSKRPMLRVTKPLRLMGAVINARRYDRHDARGEEYPPITIRGDNLRPITYKMPIASSQVKSAILFAGLYTKGLTRIIEPMKTRDHTERMLKLFRADIKAKYNTIVIKGNRELFSPGRISLPGDISSASFFIALATLLPHSRILLKNVSLNPSRMGIIKVLKRMGADIRVTSYELRVTSYEPMGDLIVRSSHLRGTIVKKEEIPTLIDELPILMVAACYARNKTILEGVTELRVKETDRIRSMSKNLKEMGADIRILKTLQSEKIIIQGARRLKGTQVRSFGDHRTAMSMVVAGLAAQGETKIDNISCINKSFPNFFNLLKTLLH